MKRYIEGVNRDHRTLFPDSLEDWVDEDNPVRVIDVFVDELNLRGLGFDRAEPEATGRPGYHPSVLLKLYIYGYVNRVHSSRRLEREAGRNIEVMWLVGRLVPDPQDNRRFPQGQRRRRPVRSARNSSSFADGSVFYRRQVWRLTDRSSKLSTTGIGTSPRPK